MKYLTSLFTILIFVTSAIGQNKMAITEDGKSVMLKANNTWQIIDKESEAKIHQCESSGHEEPKTDENIQSYLKKIQLSAEDLKKRVAKDNNCTVEEVFLVNVSETKGNGDYVLCVKGKEKNYSRTDFFFHKKGEFPIVFH